MQQQPNTPPTNTTNPLVEGALVVLAGVLILIGAVLLYLDKIDIGFASFLFMAAFSLIGINLAYKAPSPTQQAQLGAQQQNVQQIAREAMAVLPMFANLLHSHAPANVAPPQPFRPTITSIVPNSPFGANPAAAGTTTQSVPNLAGTATTMVLTQPVQLPPVVRPVQQPIAPPVPQTQQFKPPSPLPDISMPMASMPRQQQAPTQ